MKTKIVISVLILLGAGVNAAEESLWLPPQPPLWNSSSFVPFLILEPERSIRLQQVFDSDAFLPHAPLGAWIKEISFAVDSGTGPFFGTTLNDVQVNLSTTLREPDGLDPVFANNIGGDEITVYGRGPLTLPGSLMLHVVEFHTPFFYDPGEGNLLLDIWNYEGYVSDPTTRPQYFAHIEMGDSVSSVVGINADDAVGFAATGGVVTRFTFTPVPEPSVVVLAGLGVLILSLVSISRLMRKDLRHVPV